MRAQAGRTDEEAEGDRREHAEGREPRRDEEEPRTKIRFLDQLCTLYVDVE